MSTPSASTKKIDDLLKDTGKLLDDVRGRSLGNGFDFGYGGLGAFDGFGYGLGGHFGLGAYRGFGYGSALTPYSGLGLGACRGFGYGSALTPYSGLGLGACRGFGYGSSFGGLGAYSGFGAPTFGYSGLGGLGPCGGFGYGSALSTGFGLGGSSLAPGFGLGGFGYGSFAPSTSKDASKDAKTLPSDFAFSRGAFGGYPGFGAYASGFGPGFGASYLGFGLGGLGYGNALTRGFGLGGFGYGSFAPSTSKDASKDAKTLPSDLACSRGAFGGYPGFGAYASGFSPGFGASYLAPGSFSGLNNHFW